jgi:hypothetical protein
MNLLHEISLLEPYAAYDGGYTDGYILNHIQCRSTATGFIKELNQLVEQGLIIKYVPGGVRHPRYRLATIEEIIHSKLRK